MAPQKSIEWEVSHTLLQGWLGLPRDQVKVTVCDGVVHLGGELECRSQVPTLTERVKAVEGVVAVDAELTWRADDVMVTPGWPLPLV